METPSAETPATHPLLTFVDRSPMDGAELSQIREELGHAVGQEVTQTDLGLALGFTQVHVSRLENGRKTIQEGTAVAVRLLRDRVRISCSDAPGDSGLAEYAGS